MLAGVAFVAMPVAASAQGAPDRAAVEDAASGLTDIIVTAEKRSVFLQDVPQAITAFSADERQLAGIDTLQDFANFTPGLSYSASNDRVFIRGIGRQTNTNGSDPGVSTYTDGIYDASTNSIAASDFFIERVEVLRGPQGTLYGRNSIGGAINAISHRPTDEFEGKIRGTLANYKQYNLEASISGPLMEGLRARLAGGTYNQDQGYFTNIGNGESEGGRGHRRYFEVQVEADLSPDVVAWVKAFAGSTDLFPRTNNRIGAFDFSPYPTNSITPGAAFGLLLPGVVALNPSLTPAGADDIRHINTDTTQRERMGDNVGVAADLRWTLPGFDVRLLGGYQTYRTDTTYELDDTSVRSYTFPLAVGGGYCGFLPGCQPLTVNPSQEVALFNDKSFGSLELNLSSNGDGPLQWVAGAYYYNETLDQATHFRAPEQMELRMPANGPANPDGDFVYAASRLKTRSFALFGQADYQLTDAVRLTGGLRYTWDKKSGDESFRILCFGCGGYSPDLYGSYTPALDITATQISLAAAPGVSEAVTIDPTTGRANRGLSGNWSALTGTAAVEYQLAEDQLAFLRFSRGYKAGGFNAGGISALPQTGSEHVNAYEAGYKGTFGSAFRFNLAGYFYDYFGLQVPLSVTQPGGAQLTQFFNLSRSKSYGVEAEAIWQPAPALQLAANYGFGHSNISRGCCFVDGQDPLAVQPGAQPSGPAMLGQQPQSVAGEQLPYTPKHKVALNALYSFVMQPGTLSLSGSYTWRSSSYGNIFNRPYNRMPGYDQVDARVIWTDADDRFRLIGFVKNLFDTTGYDGATGNLLASPPAAPSQVAQTYALTPPRTYGVQIEFRFR